MRARTQCGPSLLLFRWYCSISPGYLDIILFLVSYLIVLENFLLHRATPFTCTGVCQCESARIIKLIKCAGTARARGPAQNITFVMGLCPKMKKEWNKWKNHF